MIYNLSTILRETMKQTNNKEKKKEINTIKNIPSSFLENKTKPKFPYNLKIDVELANQKSIELYKKYNNNFNTKPINMFSILDLDKNKNKDKNKDKVTLVEQKLNKSGLAICGICFLTFLAYSYFKKT
jgi:hypothetical protein